MLGKLKVQSSKLKTVTFFKLPSAGQILKVLKFLTIVLTFNILVLSLPSPVYADHCTKEQEEAGIPGSYTGPLNQYCVGTSRHLNLDNCRHSDVQNCPTNTHCAIEESDELITGIPSPNITRCVPNTAPTGTSTNEAAGLKQIEDVFKNVISVVVGLGFIVSLIMLIFAGFKYLTSGGEPKAVQAAHQTFTWALLGILFLAIAWLVLKLVEAFTGVQVTFFDIRTLCMGGLDWCK